MSEFRNRRIIERRILKLATAGFCCFVAGCAKKDTGAGDSAAAVAADTQAAAVDSSSASNQPATTFAEGGIPGKPGKDKDTKDYLGRVTFPEPADSKDKIDHDVTCHKAGSDIASHLVVHAVNYADKIHWDQVTQGGPTHFFARVKVLKNDCLDLGLKKNEEGYLAVGPNAAGALVVSVYRKHPDGVEDATLPAPAKVRYCNTGTPGGPAAHLQDPGDCKDTTPHLMQSSKLKSTEHIKGQDFRINLHDQGLWISCSTGCCEVLFS